MISLKQRPPAPLTVATVCRASPEAAQRFTLWMSRLGARRIILFFDLRENEPIPERLVTPGADVEEIYCTRDFWRGVVDRDPSQLSIERKQRLCFDLAYKSIERSDWIAFCDIDELLVPRQDFSSLFESARNVEQIIADTCEAMFVAGNDPNDFQSWSVGRRPIRKLPTLDKILLHRTPLFRTLTNFGLVGHAAGKAIVRGGIRNFSAGIHQHFRMNDKERLRLTSAELELDLVHYDGYSLADWRAKHAMRAQQMVIIGARMDARLAQSEIVQLCNSTAAEIRFHKLLYGAEESYQNLLDQEYSLEKIVDIDY